MRNKVLRIAQMLARILGEFIISPFCYGNVNDFNTIEVELHMLKLEKKDLWNLRKRVLFILLAKTSEQIICEAGEL